MNYVFYTLLILAAVYVVLHIGDVFSWYGNIVKTIWKKIFKGE